MKQSYIRWIFIALLVLAVFGALSAITSDSEEETKTDEVENNEENNAVENNENTVENNNTNDEPENEVEEMEYNDKFIFGEFTVDRMSAIIEDDTLTFKYRYTNQSGREAAFTGMAFITVTQNSDKLDTDAYDVMKNNYVLKPIKDGQTTSITMKYDLISNDPVEIKFKPMNEYDDTIETLEIETLSNQP